MKGTIRIALGFAMLIAAVGVMEDCGGACYEPLGLFEIALAAVLVMGGAFFSLWGAAAANEDA